MAEGYEPRPQSYDLQEGTLAKYTDVSGTLVNTACYKIGNVVNVGGTINSMTNQVANGALFQIPTGFRPATTTRCIGLIVLTGQSSGIPTNLSIYTDGKVSVSYSQSFTITAVVFAATYPIT